MKVILSRKGMDSSCGGFPSAIVDKKLILFPIPNYVDNIKYSDIFSGYKDYSMFDLFSKISNKLILIVLTKDTKCHLDPDISYESLPRQINWRGAFGQSGAAQTVLEKSGVSKNDIFLFFGWFGEYIDLGNCFKFNNGTGKHILYGYLQVGDILYPNRETTPDWLCYHSHVKRERKNNCIYIAKETCSWNKKIPGYGMLKFCNDVILTKKGYSRSKWLLPDFFREVSIGYHSENSWKENYFQSAHRGQEFVISPNDNINLWAVNLIEKNHIPGCRC